MAKQDALFLLEVLIDKIVFVKSPCFSDKDFRTCVKVECPAVEPLEICDDDPGSCVAKSGGPFVKTFNSGKSCLFSLPEADISKAMSKFPVQVTVYKSLPCGCLPTKIVMGEATIDMTKEFVASRNKYLEDPTSVSYEALKDSFRIVSPDKAETGEIVMFLRISCFGKLIVTRFQGATGLPNLGAGGQPAIVDRSCMPRRDFQTTDDPCVCGAAKAASGPSGSDPCKAPCKHGGQVKGHGVCPIAQDPYNSMPCEDPDDPCYCTGPKARKQEQMVCRNTDQYCLHVPKGALPTMPFSEDLKEEKLRKINESFYLDIFKAESWTPYSETISTKDASSLSYFRDLDISSGQFQDNHGLLTKSLCTVKSKTCSMLLSGRIDNISNSCYDFLYSYEIPENMYRKGDTTVYMTLFDDYSRHQTSGTQATATLNKCLQVNTPYSARDSLGRSKPVCINSNDRSRYHISAENYQNEKYNLPGNLTNSDIYYFSKKRNHSDNVDFMGMGLKTKRQKSPTEQEKDTKFKDGKDSKGKGNTSGKSVSIKDEKQNDSCFSCKPEMIATVSHIQIGPKEPCPYLGMEPCIGPKCLVATPGRDEQAPVKVTTVTNPRRGVFELVIRRMTGAPLAKNELMLEWTPPPSYPTPCGPPCGPPYPTVCSLYPCRIPKYKINCRPSFCKPSKCCKKPKPCRTSSCRAARCPPAPCRPPACRPSSCRPGPCRLPCRPKPCRPVPCKLTPCRPALCRPKPCRFASCRPSRCGPMPCAPARCPSKSCFPSPCRSITCSALLYQLVPCAPPSCQPSPCPSVPCRKVPCSPPPCRRAPCRRISPCRRKIQAKYILSARPSLTCKKCCKPCLSSPCGSPCNPPCGSPPCGPSPCGSPCSPPPCGIPPCNSKPCSSSPCLRRCPVGYKRPRKFRSQPKIKARRSRISPCFNRSIACRVVRGRSGPCIRCCGPCIRCPRKACSVFPFKPKCCYSTCSPCC